MAKVALVLSGGGAKGAFQFGAEQYLREEGGYRWDVIAGVSVGALNGAMLATNKFERLETLWRTVKREDVYRYRPLPFALFRLLFGARGLYDHSPLLRLIRREFEPARLEKELVIGAVSLRTGAYLPFSSAFAHAHPQTFERALFASSSIPVIFPPVDIAADIQDAVDGGLRNLSPLGDVLGSNPDEIVVIHTEPREKGPAERRLGTIVAVAERSLSIVLDEILQSDLREFLRVNDLVAQAEAQGVTLRKPDGTPYKRYRCTIIEPDDTLGSALDFSRASLDAWIKLGRQKAEEVLSQSFAADTASRR